jgi:hypothetical protein
MSVMELLAEVFKDSPEVSPLSPLVSPQENRASCSFSPHSPHSPQGIAETGKDRLAVAIVKRLVPCPVCAGLDFIERRQGGFFCIECQPTLQKDVLRLCKAPGKIVRASGFGCGRCGHNVYRQIPIGWLCEGCGMDINIIGGSRGPALIN